MNFVFAFNYIYIFKILQSADSSSCDSN